MSRPTEAYIICATPRSGSTMLCDLLAATGVAGQPESYYRRQSIADYCEEFDLPMGEIGNPDFERAYLDAVLRQGTGSTGMFGLRLMWESAKELAPLLARLYPQAGDDAARLASAFGAPTYIHLSRKDKLAQAISRLRAEQSGLWHRSADGTERERTAPPREPEYDHDRLAGFVAEAEADDHAWLTWFATHRIEPVRIVYEQFSADPKATLAGLLTALGRDASIANAVEVRTSRLADETSQEWARRFAAESG